MSTRCFPSSFGSICHIHFRRYCLENFMAVILAFRMELVYQFWIFILLQYPPPADKNLLYIERPNNSAPDMNISIMDSLILCMLGNFECMLLSSADFFQNQLFPSGIPSECQTVWIEIMPYILSGLIWVQTICKGYQLMNSMQ